MAGSFGRLEQAARRDQPCVQFREMTKDELKGSPQTLPNPCVLTAIACSCCEDNISQQRGLNIQY